MKEHRILIVTGSLGIGGLETYVVNVIQKMDRRRNRPVILYEGRGRDEYVEKLLELGVPIYKEKYVPNPLPFLRLLRRIRNEHSINVVCDFRSDLAGPVLWCSRLLGVEKRIAMYRNAARRYRQDAINVSIAKVFHRLVERHATSITGNTGPVLDYYFENWKTDQKYRVINNGIDVGRFSIERDKDGLLEELGLDKNSFLVGHVGRFVKQKNHETMIEAMREVVRKHPEARLLLIGEGELKEKIEERIVARGMGKNIFTLGLRLDVPRILSSIDAFLFPSLHEGMPNALVEAMGSGLPFVAAKIGEIEEIVPQELGEQLVNPKDEESMARKICFLIENRKQASKNGEIARNWVQERFTIEKSVEELCRLWQE